MIKQFLLQAFLAATAVLAYLDTAGLSYILPERYAWVPLAIGVANILLASLRSAKVDRSE